MTFYKNNQRLTKVERIILFNVLLIQHKEINPRFNRKETENAFNSIIERIKEKQEMLLSDTKFQNLSRDDVLLFHFIWELVLRDQNITAGRAMKNGKAFFNLEVDHIQDRLNQFVENGFLQPFYSENQDIEYAFTENYHIIMGHVLFKYPIWKYVYNDLNKSALQSYIYRKYCQQTYGIDLYQLGQVTRNQLDKLLDVYNGDRNSIVMELGCGTGHISEYIHDNIRSEYYCSDISDYAVEHAIHRNKDTRPGLYFDTKNIYQLDYKKNYFDSIIAIDCLHYLLGLDDVIKELKTFLKPGGTLYSFWESWIPDESSLEMKNPESTRLGKILSELNIQFEAWDFSDDNKTAWKNTVKNLKTFKDDFVREGSELIYESRLDEIGRIDNSIDSSRFLYKIKLG